MPIVAFNTFETSRLRLRHFTAADISAFMAYRNDPAVAKYQSWESISEGEAWAFLEQQKAIQLGVPGQGGSDLYAILREEWLDQYPLAS